MQSCVLFSTAAAATRRINCRSSYKNAAIKELLYPPLSHCSNFATYIHRSNFKIKFTLWHLFIMGTRFLYVNVKIFCTYVLAWFVIIVVNHWFTYIKFVLVMMFVFGSYLKTYLVYISKVYSLVNWHWNFENFIF